jgi:hypothetical protein
MGGLKSGHQALGKKDKRRHRRLCAAIGDTLSIRLEFDHLPRANSETDVFFFIIFFNTPFACGGELHYSVKLHKNMAVPFFGDRDHLG